MSLEVMINYAEDGGAFKQRLIYIHFVTNFKTFTSMA